MNLFWKIFAWFWGAMVAMGGALYLTVTATQPDPLPAAWRQATSQSLAVYASQTAAAFESGGKTELAAALQQLRRNGRARLWLYGAAGTPLGRGPREETLDEPGLEPPFGSPFRNDLDGHNHPRNGDRFESFGRPDGFGPGRGPVPERVDEALNHLVERALNDENNAALFDLTGRVVLVALRVTGPSGRQYALAGEMMRPQEGRAPFESSALILRIGAVLLTGTLGCYGLVRYLTSPIVALRSATRRLAEGDLQARTGANNRRRDELADLGRDFDSMAERIEELMLSQRRLLGDISHELRSPLTRLGVALALARHYETAPEARAAHERIGHESARLNTLIGQLLQLARLESEGHQAAPQSTSSEPIDLALLLRVVADDAAFEARERGRNVRVKINNACQVRGNEALLHSAIENVVRNAVRHTREGTTVEISLESREAWASESEYGSAIVTVRDHGEGVPEEALSELFKPFYRVESARDRDSGGVGLGLAITERAIAAHGGKVRAANASDGLIVEMELPLAPTVAAGIEIT